MWRAEPGPGAQAALPIGRGVDGRPAGGREGLQPGNDRFFPGKDTSLGAQPVMSQPIKNSWGEFPGGPVVRTVRCHRPGSR